MTQILSNDVLQDEMAVSLARVMAAANQSALEHGVYARKSLITISQTENGSCWRVNYGPQNYVGKRGGDLSVEVNAVDARVRRVLQGQ